MRSITTWIFNRDEPLSLASRFSDMEGTVLLQSGGGLDSARHSYLCLFPKEKITLNAQKGCWERLEEAMGAFDSALPIPKWVGYLGYEMGSFADNDIETPYFSAQTPDCSFYRPSAVIHFDHSTSKATLYGEGEISLERERTLLPSELQLGFCSDTLESYIKKIAQAKEWILDGEIYQVNLSQEFHLEGKSDPFSLFQKVSLLNPAPFSAYAQCGDFALVSSSPERFLSRKGDLLETRPIKGTAPRGKTPEEDARNRRTLLSSEKERAELLMITDLMRNDLGRVSAPGSVKTREIWRCESYTNVFHLLSIIEGRSKKSPVSLVRQLFPGGSITGCPKLRAMEAIALLEKRPRGVYTGSIGYFAANGDFDFNIAIRTLVVHPSHVQVQLGGAIVIDSDPVKEFEETLHKGESLFKVLGAHELCVL
ncbi:MAG: anthranilate synthase component I family protein [Chlamydiales bacterium]|nr:anthranilate synthase component I family protein [Chlamydiales bacterium]